ncbi:hypothetical protein [Kingella oralis]|uniref:hypothetical protein n=1 Tax=Kingella oralis TaxID=505 RepID=UPI0034E3FD32
MERRRFATKWRMKQNMTGLPRCWRAIAAPSVVDFAKISAKPKPPPIIRQNTHLAVYHAQAAQPSPSIPKAA